MKARESGLHHTSKERPAFSSRQLCAEVTTVKCRGEAGFLQRMDEFISEGRIVVSNKG